MGKGIRESDSTVDCRQRQLITNSREQNLTTKVMVDQEERRGELQGYSQQFPSQQFSLPNSFPPE